MTVKTAFPPAPVDAVYASARICGDRVLGVAGYDGKALRRPSVFQVSNQAPIAGGGWPLRRGADHE